MDEALEAERVTLCGARYEYTVERKALPAGHRRFAGFKRRLVTLNWPQAFTG
jgi:hypothetical protein